MTLIQASPGGCVNRIVEFSLRVEAAYLAVLRFVILIVATIFIGFSVYYLVDGARKLSTSTLVATEKVAVTPQEVIGAMARAKERSELSEGKAPSLDSAAGKRFTAFIRNQFTPYHATYAALARQYNKPEDQILGVDALARELGYTLEAYADGADPALTLFVENADYAAQLRATAAALPKDRGVNNRLAQYLAAQKTAQSCSTTYQRRRVWDSRSMACDEWWLRPIGCSVIRNVPIEQCVAAYPDGILSPLAAFTQMDTGFRQIWMKRGEDNAAAADAKRSQLAATKADSVPTLMRAAYVFGAFLVVMFLFLVIAAERHLRRLAQASAPIAE